MQPELFKYVVVSSVALKDRVWWRHSCGFLGISTGNELMFRV